ncbi:hypothetical protein AA313_de0204769 [Arthrobotrys entomopaga]|nr:hypothetical protein AA313_de0204769 [Arthrobotrys entomopaga]
MRAAEDTLEPSSSKGASTKRRSRGESVKARRTPRTPNNSVDSEYADLSSPLQEYSQSDLRVSLNPFSYFSRGRTLSAVEEDPDTPSRGGSGSKPEDTSGISGSTDIRSPGDTGKKTPPGEGGSKAKTPPPTDESTRKTPPPPDGSTTVSTPVPDEGAKTMSPPPDGSAKTPPPVDATLEAPFEKFTSPRSPTADDEDASDDEDDSSIRRAHFMRSYRAMIGQLSDGSSPISSTGTDLDSYSQGEAEVLRAILTKDKDKEEVIRDVVADFDEMNRKAILHARRNPDSRYFKGRHSLWVERMNTSTGMFPELPDVNMCKHCEMDADRSELPHVVYLNQTAGRYRLCPHWRPVITPHGFSESEYAYGGSQGCPFCGLPRGTQGILHRRDCHFFISNSNYAVVDLTKPDEFATGLADDPDFKKLEEDPTAFNGIEPQDSGKPEDLKPNLQFPVADPEPESSSDDDLSEFSYSDEDENDLLRPDLPPSDKTDKDKDKDKDTGKADKPPSTPGLATPGSSTPDKNEYAAATLRPLTDKDHIANASHLKAVQLILKDPKITSGAHAHYATGVRDIKPMPAAESSRRTHITATMTKTNLTRPFWERNSYIRASTTDFSSDKAFTQRLPDNILENTADIRKKLGQPDPTLAGANWAGPARILVNGGERWFHSRLADDKAVYDSWRSCTVSDVDKTTFKVNTSAPTFPNTFLTEDTLEDLNWSGDSGTIVIHPTAPKIPVKPKVITPDGSSTDKFDADAAAKAKAEREKADKEAAEKAKKDKAEKDKADKEEVEKKGAEKEKADKVEAEKKKAEKEKADKDEAEKRKAEKDKADKEAADKAAKEKAEKEKAEKEKAEKEKADKEKADKEKADKEKVEKEKKKDGEKKDGDSKSKEKTDWADKADGKDVADADGDDADDAEDADADDADDADADGAGKKDGSDKKDDGSTGKKSGKPDLGLPADATAETVGKAAATHLEYTILPVAGSKGKGIRHCRHCDAQTHCLSESRRFQHYGKCWPSWPGPPADGHDTKSKSKRRRRKSRVIKGKSKKGGAKGTRTAEREGKVVFGKRTTAASSESSDERASDDEEDDEETESESISEDDDAAERGSEDDDASDRGGEEEEETSDEVEEVQEVQEEKQEQEQEQEEQEQEEREDDDDDEVESLSSDEGKRMGKTPKTRNIDIQQPEDDKENFKHEQEGQVLESRKKAGRKPKKIPKTPEFILSSSSVASGSREVTPESSLSPTSRLLKRKRSSAPLQESTDQDTTAQATTTPLLPEENLVSTHKSKAKSRPFVPKKATKVTALTKLTDLKVSSRQSRGKIIEVEERTFTRSARGKTLGEKIFTEVIETIRKPGEDEAVYNLYRFGEGELPTTLQKPEKRRKIEEQIEDIEPSDEKGAVVSTKETPSKLKTPKRKTPVSDDSDNEQTKPKKKKLVKGVKESSNDVEEEEQELPPKTPKTTKKVAFDTPTSKTDRKYKLYRKTPSLGSKIKKAEEPKKKKAKKADK